VEDKQMNLRSWHQCVTAWL